MVTPVRAAQAAFSRLGRSQELPGLAAAVVALVLAVLCAVLGFETGALVLLLVSTVGELFFEKRGSSSSVLLEQGSLGIPMRFALRVVVGLVVAGDRIDSVAAWRMLTLVSIVFALVLCGRALHQEYRRVGPLKPMTTRNIAGMSRRVTGYRPIADGLVRLQGVSLAP